jgi:hypothetical protein
MEPVARQWHARGQGFKSPQLHPRPEAMFGPSRLQIPRLGQQIGSNPCCLGRSGRPAKRQRRPASPPGNGHIRPPAATLAPATKHRIGRAGQIDSSRGNDLILLRVLHPGLFPQDQPSDLGERWTAGDRCEPLDSDGVWTKRGPGRPAQWSDPGYPSAWCSGLAPSAIGEARWFR